MVTIQNAIPVVFVASFITVVVMAIRHKGKGSASTNNQQHDHAPATNINGLPMVGGVDVLGNPFGTSQNH